MKQRSPQNKNRLIRWLFVLAFVVVLPLWESTLSPSERLKQLGSSDAHVVLLRAAKNGGDTIIATDDQGSKWQMTSAKDPPLRILLDRKVKPGPPLTVGTRIRRQGSMMLLDLVIKGQAGETYGPSITKDGKRVRSSAPSFTVVGRSGKVVGSGKFQFG